MIIAEIAAIKNVKLNAIWTTATAKAVSQAGAVIHNWLSSLQDMNHEDNMYLLLL